MTGRNQSEELLMLVYDLALSVFDPLEFDRYVGNQGLGLVVVRDDLLDFILHAFRESLGWLGRTLASIRVGLRRAREHAARLGLLLSF